MHNTACRPAWPRPSSWVPPRPCPWAPAVVCIYVERERDRYIYIYIEREIAIDIDIDIDMYIYIYIVNMYINIYIYTHMYIHIRPASMSSCGRVPLRGGCGHTPSAVHAPVSASLANPSYGDSSLSTRAACLNVVYLCKHYFAVLVRGSRCLMKPSLLLWFQGSRATLWTHDCLPSLPARRILRWRQTPPNQTSPELDVPKLGGNHVRRACR